MPFQPGTWYKLPDNCTTSFSLTYLRCAEWGVQFILQCLYYTAQYTWECVQWAWQTATQCAWWALLFCVIFAIVVSLVCIAVALVVYLVCAAFTVIELVVCLLWTVISIIFCLSKANGGTAFLLTDGTVMVQESASLGPLVYGTHRWWKLTPDASGSYAHGKWTRLADAHVARTAYASAVLADGRVVVCGGEYSDSSLIIKNDDTNSCEIYDPVANTWTVIPSPLDDRSVVWENVGDAPGTLLPDGMFLVGSIADTKVALLDPVTDPVNPTWTALDRRPSLVKRSTEESWVLMPDNTVAAPGCLSTPNTWIYQIAPKTWVKTNDLSTPIVDDSPGVFEIGPGLLLYDGRAFFLGANEHTAFYSPMGQQWVNGPDVPDQVVGGSSTKLGIEDGPACLLVNGNVLFSAGKKGSPLGGGADSSPSLFFEFDGLQFDRTNDPPNNGGSTMFSRLLLLPNGDVMYTRDNDSSFYAYHSDSAAPRDSFRPVIQTCPGTIMVGSTVQISGLQFNGLSQAVAYGDDAQMATNYPLVRIVNNQLGNVRYCRTFNHTTVDGNGHVVPSMGVSPNTAVTTNVVIPADIEPGNSSLYVVANGIPSAPFDIYVSELF